MKRLLCTFGILAALGITASDYILASGGKTTYTIVVADDAIPAERTGATELANHLEQMTGARFPIVAAGDFSGGAMIAVGFNPLLPECLAAAAYPALGPEELVIDGDTDILLLAGGRPRGTLYAAYEFLERLGVRWYTPTETLIPSIPDLTVAAAPYRYTSPFRSRTQVPGNGVTPAWCARNRMNSFLEWGNPGEEYGGGIAQGPDMHTFWRILNPKEFEVHPEWAAEVDGKRETQTANHHWGVCLSDAELRRHLIRQTLAWVRRNPAVTDVWIGQNDGSPYCSCADCQSWYDAHGGAPSAAIVRLLNELAEAMREEFPDKRIKTLAYGWSLPPPKGLRLDDRVTVMVCAAFPQCATLGKDPETEEFLTDLAAWRQVASDFEVYIYSYPTDSSWFPMPCLYSQARNIQFLSHADIASIHQELFGVGTGDGGDLVHLRAWLSARLMWHPDADIAQLVEDFCRGYYREAADAVLAAIELTHQQVENGQLPPSGNLSFAVPAYVDAAVVTEVRSNLEAAYRQIADPELKRRVGYVLLPYLWADYWLGFTGFGVYDATTRSWGIPMPERERRAAEGELIKALMLENGVGTLRLGVALNPNSLRLAEMCRSYPAVALKNEFLSTVVVPGNYGKIVVLESPSFQPLKAAWGNLLLQYPRIGYWSDRFCGAEVTNLQVGAQNERELTLKANMPLGTAEKRFRLDGDTLHYTVRFTANSACQGTLRTAPLLDLNPEGFDLYPTLYLKTVDGWRAVPLGRAGSMWYQTANLDLTGYQGTLLLVAEKSGNALEITIPAVELGQLGYMYDRYDFDPKGTGRVLELFCDAPDRSLQAGESIAMTLGIRLLTSAQAEALLHP